MAGPQTMPKAAIGKDASSSSSDTISVEVRLPAPLAALLQSRADDSKSSLGSAIGGIVTRYHQFPVDDLKGMYISGAARTKIEALLGYSIQSPEEIAQHLERALSFAIAYQAKDADSGKTGWLSQRVTLTADQLDIMNGRNGDQTPMPEYVKGVVEQGLEMYARGMF